MRLFGLIGYPLSHSFSQKYFEEKFKREEITDCRYELFPLKSIDNLKEILKQNPNLEGLNVTIPYKQQVLPYLYSFSDILKEIKACNCIKIIEGKLFGYNTDVIGFEKSLLPLLKPWHKRALILGNGGATAAVTFVLKKLRIGFDIVSRSLHANSTLCYKDLGEQVMKGSLLIINTTPLGMHPQTDQYPNIPYEFITSKHLLYDLIYNPAKTLFLRKGEEKGATIKNGEEMLVLQAEESWRIWNERQ
jgi:shikimate dehydrogenase